MKSEAEVRALLKKIESDERLWYKPALVQINAPLALIQVEGETKANMLRWVLGMKHNNFKPKLED
jgi:hypothetical protein